MNAGNYHSDMNNPDLVRQQLIQFVCRLTRSKLETREWDSNPLAVLGGSSIYGQYLFWKEIVVFLLLEDYDIGPLRFQQERNNIGPGSVGCNTLVYVIHYKI